MPKIPKPKCKACGGTGESSGGGACVPCNGMGEAKFKRPRGKHKAGSRKSYTKKGLEYLAEGLENTR